MVLQLASLQGSSEPLGTPSDFAESSLQANAIKGDDVSRLFGEAPKSQEAVATAASGFVQATRGKGACLVRRTCHGWNDRCSQ